MRTLLAAVITAAALLAPAQLSTASAAPAPGRAVVVVSGAAAVSPFTTPQESCATGLAAGNTDTAIRQYLLEQGYTVYTSPAMTGGGPVTDQTGFGPFGGCPLTLPADMTVDSTGGIDAGGERLARFLTHLHTERGVEEVDVIAHSMGGLFSRAAIRDLQSAGSPIRIRSLTTIGTPWQGSYLADYANGAIPLGDCAGDAFCEIIMTGAAAQAQELAARPDRQVSHDHLMGPSGWNAAQAGVLDDIPVTLVAGERFTRPDANPQVWPNDGIVAARSALAAELDDAILPHRRCVTFDDTHSIYFSDLAGLPWSTGLTWDPRVFDTLRAAIETASTDQPTRQGCPVA